MAGYDPNNDISRQLHMKAIIAKWANPKVGAKRNMRKDALKSSSSKSKKRYQRNWAFNPHNPDPKFILRTTVADKELWGPEEEVEQKEREDTLRDLTNMESDDDMTKPFVLTAAHKAVADSSRKELNALAASSLHSFPMTSSDDLALDFAITDAVLIHNARKRKAREWEESWRCVGSAITDQSEKDVENVTSNFVTASIASQEGIY